MKDKCEECGWFDDTHRYGCSKSEPLPVRPESSGWLPEWVEIKKKVKRNEKITALECLIYNNEPSGEPQRSAFRLHVANAIKEANRVIDGKLSTYHHD